MSVCDMCPSAIVSGDANEYYQGCSCFGLHEYDPIHREIVPPRTCTRAPILKLLAEAKEVDHLYINKSPDQLGKGGERVSFWIRR